MLLIFDEEVSFDFDRMMVVSPCRTLYILTLASTLRRYVVTSCASNQRKNVFLRNFCCFISFVFLGIILFILFFFVFVFNVRGYFPSPFVFAPIFFLSAAVTLFLRRRDAADVSLERSDDDKML